MKVSAMKLIKIILDQMSSIGKPQKKFVTKAVQAFLSVGGRLTFSNMSRYVSTCEKTFRRQFSKAFNFAEFNRKAVDLFYAKTNRVLAIAFDPLHMEKSGEKTYGKGSFWSGGTGRVEKGVEASLICVIDLVQRIAFPLIAKQTPNSEEFKEMCKTSPGTTRIDYFLNFIVSTISMFPAGVKYILVDAYFFKEKFVAGICNVGLHVISKMRKDAKLLLLYTGPQKARGRRKKYDGVLDFEQLQDIPTDETDIVLRSTTAYSVALECNVLVVMVRKLRADGKVATALLFSTDTTMLPLDVYHYYGARFQIEFVIRDAKQYTGLTHCQSRAKERIDFHINMSFMAITVARFNEYQRNGTSAPCSVATQCAINHNEMLMESIFPMLGLDLLAFKSLPAYQQALSYGAINR